MLSNNCVVAIGVSGGKDSCACALAVADYLQQIQHRGPKLLIHADLGRTEWRDSLPMCQRLATLIGWELVVVRRSTGDMLSRWQQRWQNNLERYRKLLCVRLILPWSTPSMRFCTSEMKTAVICAELKRRFPNSEILNVTGIRREESRTRAKMPVTQELRHLMRPCFLGLSWHAILETTREQVLETIANAGLELHEAYTRYRTTRVSCVFCIMGSLHDLTAAATCEENHLVYAAMVALEAESTFAFQGSRWLADVAPQLLTPELRSRIEQAKLKARQREEIESQIPKHLLYVKGWPTCLPTWHEAKLLADVRAGIAKLLGFNAEYLRADEILRRYSELLTRNLQRLSSRANRPTQ